MGTSGNGDGRPDNGGTPEELPDLPTSWGSIVIPDDPADLAAEAAIVRRELRRKARKAVWRRRLGLTADGHRSAPLRLTLVVLSIAVLATLTSLFAVMRPGQQRPVSTGRSTPSSTANKSVPALDLVDENGTPVALRGLLPAVIILVDGCSCSDDVRAAAQVVPAGVTVIALTSGRSTPSPMTAQTLTPPVRALADPAAAVRVSLELTPRPGAGAALLANRSGDVVRVLPALISVEDYRADLPKLTA